MIAAIITLYNPDSSVVDNILTISPQVDKVFLSDNSPHSNERMFDRIRNVEYLFNAENLALSGAFNKILKNVKNEWNKNDYIVFFDQDSFIEENHIKKLVNEYETLKKYGLNVGCIGPIFFNRTLGRIAIPKIKRQLTPNSFIVKSVITSSMLTTYGTLSEVGYWNENVFLDFADWDLCWRIMEKGKICVETKSVVLNHALGLSYKKIGFWKIAVGNPIREYYQTRNYLYLLPKRYVPFKYKVRFVRNLLIRPILHLVFLENGRERLQYVKRGCIDYKKKYFGEYRY